MAYDRRVVSEMIGWLVALFLLFIAPAHAQCNGIFGANQACGSVGGGPPSQVPFSTIAGANAPQVVNVTTYGWNCDSTDHSTQAQNAINAVSNAGGGTLFFPACPQAIFTATGSGTNLTVTGISGTIQIGMLINSLSAGIPAGTAIAAQQSGSSGGNGVYTTSQATTISAAQTIGNLTYRADSQLIIPILNYGPSGYQWSSSIRMSGPGGGANWQGGTANNSINLAYPYANPSIIDLRFHGQKSSAVGYVATGGTLYNNGSTTTFTAQFTATGGTCATPMQFTASAVGGVIQAVSLGIQDLNTQIAQTVRAICAVPPPNPVSATCTNCTAGSGATFNLYWTDGKINAFGVGSVEIDHLYFIDLSASNSTPFMYFTNAMANVHDNNFACTGNSSQDAIVLGGMQGINYLTQDGDEAFLGYKPTIERNQFNFCNRFVFVRTFGDNLVFANNIGGDNCSGDRLVEFIDGSTLVGVYNNAVRDNWFEACKGGSLKWPIVLTNGVTNSFFTNNIIVDIDGARATNYVSDYRIVDASSSGNLFELSLGCWFYYPSTNCTTFSGNLTGINQNTITGQMVGAYRSGGNGQQTYTYYQNFGQGAFVHGNYGRNDFGGTACPNQQIAIADTSDQGLLG